MTFNNNKVSPSPVSQDSQMLSGWDLAQNCQIHSKKDCQRLGREDKKKITNSYF